MLLLLILPKEMVVTGVSYRKKGAPGLWTTYPGESLFMEEDYGFWTGLSR
jgi:hypothetical protein